MCQGRKPDSSRRSAGYHPDFRILLRNRLKRANCRFPSDAFHSKFSDSSPDVVGIRMTFPLWGDFADVAFVRRPRNHRRCAKDDLSCVHFVGRFTLDPPTKYQHVRLQLFPRVLISVSSSFLGTFLLDKQKKSTRTCVLVE
jgi:hypothetical protein